MYSVSSKLNLGNCDNKGQVIRNMEPIDYMVYMELGASDGG